MPVGEGGHAVYTAGVGRGVGRRAQRRGTVESCDILQHIIDINSFIVCVIDM